MIKISDLIKKEKNLIEMWNYEKNKNIDVEKITSGSNKKVWWKCNKGHEWAARVCNMSKSMNCPYCNSRKILKGCNDLATLFPKLAKEWDYNKNKKDPSNYSKSAEDKVWWICPNGHSYICRIDTRARGVECPICDDKQILIGFNDIITLYPIIDEYWNYDKNKVKPWKLKKSDPNSYYWKCKICGYEWQTKIGHIIRDFNGCRICNKSINLDYSKKVSNSKLEKEWDYKKNINLKPEKVSINSREKAWWICPNGHSYSARISSRNYGSGCPYCSNQKVLSGYNDLATKKRCSKQEWNYKKNKDLNPDQIYFRSEKQAYFICPNGHEYKMKVRDYYNGNNCPICTNRIIREGINDFASFDKRLLSEWNYKKNEIKPTEISTKSTKKVWWIGECGHEWQATIYSRTIQKN